MTLGVAAGLIQSWVGLGEEERSRHLALAYDRSPFASKARNEQRLDSKDGIWALLTSARTAGESRLGEGLAGRAECLQSSN